MMKIVTLPRLEILLADKLSTVRSFSDAKGLRFEISFLDKSSLSRFTQSPMHPRLQMSAASNSTNIPLYNFPFCNYSC